MAKNSKIAADQRRREVVARHDEQRRALKAALKDLSTPANEKLLAQRALQRPPRDASPTRLRKRDAIDGRRRPHPIPADPASDRPEQTGKELTMKSSIHPTYRPVVFRDASADFSFLTRSTRSSNKTATWEDGEAYPVIDVEVSSASHPFYTGKATVLDTAGRVEKFRRRYGQAVA